MEKYSVNIMWSDEDNGYVATMPEFKNLSAFGNTYEEALEEAKVAAEGFIEALRAENLPLPEPNKASEYSGQIRFRMPRDLHQRLSIEAQRQGVSLNTYMVHLLSMNFGLCRWLSVPPMGQAQILYVRTTGTGTEIKSGEELFGFGSLSSKTMNEVYRYQEVK